jgi:hypothetical protein
MMPLSPHTVARALQVVSAGGTGIALIFAFALFDELRVRRQDREQPVQLTTEQVRPPQAGIGEGA